MAQHSHEIVAGSNEKRNKITYKKLRFEFNQRQWIVVKQEILKWVDIKQCKLTQNKRKFFLQTK